MRSVTEYAPTPPTMATADMITGGVTWSGR